MSDSAPLLPVSSKPDTLPALAVSGHSSLELFSQDRPEFSLAPGIRLKTSEWKAACVDTWIGTYINGGLSPDRRHLALATERNGSVVIRIFQTVPVPGVEKTIRLPSRQNPINSRGVIKGSLSCLQWLTDNSLLLVWGEGFLQIMDLQGRAGSLGGSPLAPMLESAHISRKSNILVTVGFPNNQPSRYPVGVTFWDLQEMEAGRMRPLDYFEILSAKYPIPACVALHPDGRHLVAIAGTHQKDGTLSLGFLARNLLTGDTQVFHECRNKHQIPKSLEFSPAGHLYIEDTEFIRRFNDRFEPDGHWELPPRNRYFPSLSVSPEGREIFVQADIGISILTPATGTWRHAHQAEGGLIRCWFLETGKLFALHFQRCLSAAILDSRQIEPPAWFGDSIGQANLAWHILPSGGFLLGGKDGRVRYFDAGLRPKKVFNTGLGPIDEIWGPQGTEEALILNTSGAVLHFDPLSDGESTHLPHFRVAGTDVSFENGSWVKRWVHNPWRIGEPPFFTNIDSRPRFTSADTYFQRCADMKRVGHFLARNDWDLRPNLPLAEFNPLRMGEHAEHLINFFGFMAVLTKNRIVMWNPDTYQLAPDREGTLRLVEDGDNVWTALDGFADAVQLGYQTGNDIFLCFKDEIWRLALDYQGRRLHVTAKAKMPGLGATMYSAKQDNFWMTGPHWFRKYTRDLETIADFLPLAGDAFLVHVPEPSEGKTGAARHPGWIWMEGGDACWDWVEVKDSSGNIVKDQAEKIRIGSRYLSRTKVEQALVDYPAFKERLRESGKGSGRHGLEEIMLLLPSNPNRNETNNPAAEEPK